MPLDETDLDRIGDKIELKMRQVMDEHKSVDHAKINGKLAKIDGKFKWFAGAAAGLAAAGTHIMQKLTHGGQ